MAKPIPSHPESELTDLRTSSPNHKVKYHDSHADTQQPFRFMDLPKELRDIIYSLASLPDTSKTQDGEQTPDEPYLTAGLSNSTTAQALSQVSCAIRQESMKAYYSNTTFVVPELPDRFASFMERVVHDGQPTVPEPDPLDMWARTWGELGAQHIRSLYISPLEGTMRITMADGINTVSFSEGARANLGAASALESAGLEAFGRPNLGITTARKIEAFLREAGGAWQLARRKEALAEISMKYPNSEVRKGNLQSLEEGLN
jgi:hypothetical protein